MYIFYDTEATGLDLDFTQLLQVALVFTDDDLNILSSKKIECRRSPWVVPSPGAMLITGFTPDDLKNSKLSHYEMMSEIEDWIKAQHWPVIFVGYNTLGFDEPALSHNLSQNLLQSDLTTAENPGSGQRNTRLDLFPVVKALSVYMPGALKLETLNEYGKPSLSLMNVAQQNGVELSAEDAHDAMNDIKATIGVAKVIRKAAPALWDHVSGLTSAEGVDKFLTSTPVFVYTDLSYGRNKSTVSASVCALDATQVVFDATQNPAAYFDMPHDELVRVIRRSFERQPAEPAPFMLVDKASQPMVAPLDLAAAVLPPSFDEAAAANNARAIANNDAFQQKVAKAAAEVIESRRRPPLKPQAEQLCDRPIAPDMQAKVQAWKDRFHDAPDWAACAKLVNEFYDEFGPELAKDHTLRRLVKFAGRIVFENAPEELTQQQRDAMMKHIATRMLNPNLKASYMTLTKARNELEVIEKERAEGKEKWKGVTDTQIRSLKLYYTALEKEYAPFSPYIVAENDNQPDGSKSVVRKVEPYKPK